MNLTYRVSAHSLARIWHKLETPERLAGCGFQGILGRHLGTNLARILARIWQSLLQPLSADQLIVRST
jgi:hypothetical protein